MFFAPFPEVSLEILKASRLMLEQVSKYQDGPSVTDGIERARNGTFEIVLSRHSHLDAATKYHSYLCFTSK